MAWIESHQSLLTHRKTGRLARALGIPKVHAVGYLHAFWWWCMDNAPNGSLQDSIPAEIADAACWEGDPEMFASALVMSGFIDLDDEGQMHVHDWMDYAGRLVQKREANAKRMKDARAKNVQLACGHSSDNIDSTCDECAAHVQRTFIARAGATNQPTKPTVPNQPTKPTEEEKEKTAAAAAAASAARDAKVTQSMEYLKQAMPAGLAEYAAETIRADGLAKDDPAAYFVKIVGMIKAQFKQAPAAIVIKAWEAARAHDAGIGYAKSVLTAEIKRTVAAAIQPAQGFIPTVHPVDASLDPEELAELKRLKAESDARYAEQVARRDREREEARRAGLV